MNLRVPVCHQHDCKGSWELYRYVVYKLLLRYVTCVQVSRKEFSRY